MKNLEFFLLATLPMLIGIIAITISLLLSIKYKTTFQRVLTFIIIALTTLSEIMLYDIFYRAMWPSFIPHRLIGCSCVLLIGQLIKQFGKKVS